MPQFKLRKGEWRPWKASKIDVLEFIYVKGALTRHDLMNEFDYSYKGADRSLVLLHKEKLIQPLFQRSTWGITELAAPLRPGRIQLLSLTWSSLVRPSFKYGRCADLLLDRQIVVSLS